MSPADRRFRLTVALFGCRCRTTLVVPPWLQRWGPRAALILIQACIAAGFVALGLMRDSRALQTHRPAAPPRTLAAAQGWSFSEREYGWPVSWWREVWASAPTPTGRWSNLISTNWNPGVVAAAAFIAWGLPIVATRSWPRRALQPEPGSRVHRLAVVAVCAGLGGLTAAWFDCVSADRMPHDQGPLSNAWRSPGFRDVESAVQRWRAGDGNDLTWKSYLLVTSAGLATGAVVGFVLARPRRQSSSGSSASDGAAATTPPPA